MNQDWPSTRRVERQLADVLDTQGGLASVCHALGDDRIIYETPASASSRIKLRLRGLELCATGQHEVHHFLSLARFCADIYLTSDEDSPRVTVEQFAEASHLDDAAAGRALALALLDGHFWDGGSSTHLTLSPFAGRLKGVSSLDDFDRRRSEFEERARRAAEQRHGVSPPSSGKRLTSWPVFETAFGRYTSVRMLGEGGAGRVYEARGDDRSTYAVKLLASQTLTIDKRRRFKNELYFCQRTRHRNIVQVHDYGVLYDGNLALPFYVMPRYETTLRRLMAPVLDPIRALAIFAQVLDGLEVAHNMGVTHRDLKPENLLYDASEDTIVVADFGVARFTADQAATIVETDARTRLANFRYAAPEQRRPGEAVGHTADIFALGMILHEMLTGDVPAGTAYQTVASVAPEYDYIDNIIRIMIRQRPEDRYTSIAEVRMTLANAARS
ncbi:MAG: serine/threonine-protein kinase [Gemmatimonadaceae bacterium]